MGATLDGRLIINVLLDAPPLTRAGFSLALLASDDPTFPERIRYYDGPDGVATDASVLGSVVRGFLDDAFAQSPRPARIAVGRLSALVKQKATIAINPVAQVRAVTINAVANGDTFDATLNGTAIAQVVAGPGDTPADVVDALILALDAIGEPVTFGDGGASFTATADTAGQPFTLTVTSSVPSNVTSVATTASRPDIGDTFEVTVNGETTATVTVAEGDTPADIIDDLVTGLNALGEPVTMADLGSSLTIEANVAGIPFVASLDASNAPSATLTATTANVGIGDGLDAIKAEANDWFGFSLSTFGRAENEAALAWAATNKKLFGGLTDDAAALVTGDTDNGLTDFAGSDNGFCLYHDEGDKHAAFNLLVNRLAVSPDESATIWSYVRLANTTPQTGLTATQLAAVKAKNGNIYSTFFGVGATAWGTTGSGIKLDLIVLKYWLEARVAESIGQLLVNRTAAGSKVPFDDIGFMQVKERVESVLATAVEVGHLVRGSTSVTMPTLATVASGDRTARLLRFTFGGQPTGAVEDASMTGYVSIDFIAAAA